MRFGVSQGTVRKAIDALAADNLVVRRQGKGTFVATHTEEQTSLFRFLRIRRNDGSDESPGEPAARRAARARRAPRSRGCSTLKPGDPVLVLRRVLEYAGEPVVLDEITLPAALFRGLTRARVDAYRGSMYSFFETAVRRADAEGATRSSGPIAADAASAAILAVAPGTPLLAGRSRDATPTATARSSGGAACARPRHHHYLNELG